MKQKKSKTLFYAVLVLIAQEHVEQALPVSLTNQ